MKTAITRSTLAATFAFVFAAAAHAAPAAEGAAAYGETAPASAATRTIVLGDHTRYINVNDGDTARFVHGDKSFTWTFDTVHRDGVTQLSKIAPEGFGDDGAKIYIAPNPLYTNG